MQMKIFEPKTLRKVSSEREAMIGVSGVVNLCHNLFNHLLYFKNMASFEDYDEFGNYIGADLDSDNEDNVLDNQFQDEPVNHPLEGYEDVNMQEVDDMALMEVDGVLKPSSIY